MLIQYSSMQASKALVGFTNLALISLSSEPLLEITSPSYLNSSYVFVAVPSTEVEGERAADPGGDCNSTSVFPRLMMRPNRQEVSSNFPIMSGRSDSLHATREQLLAIVFPESFSQVSSSLHSDI